MPIEEPPSPDSDSLLAERRAHRSDLIEERPEGDVPPEAFKVVPVPTDDSGLAGLKDSANSSRASLEPGRPPLGSRTSAQRLQAAAKRITAARIILNGDGTGRAPGIDPAKVSGGDVRR